MSTASECIAELSCILLRLISDVLLSQDLTPSDSRLHSQVDATRITQLKQAPFSGPPRPTFSKITSSTLNVDLMTLPSMNIRTRTLLPSFAARCRHPFTPA